MHDPLLSLNTCTHPDTDIALRSEPQTRKHGDVRQTRRQTQTLERNAIYILSCILILELKTPGPPHQTGDLKLNAIYILLCILISKSDCLKAGKLDRWDGVFAQESEVQGRNAALLLGPCCQFFQMIAVHQLHDLEHCDNHPHRLWMFGEMFVRPEVMEQGRENISSERPRGKHA